MNTITKINQFKYINFYYENLIFCKFLNFKMHVILEKIFKRSY